jgi:hypothetical protein
MVPIEVARRLYPEDRPSFATLLMSIPEDIEFERDMTPLLTVLTLNLRRFQPLGVPTLDPFRQVP